MTVQIPFRVDIEPSESGRGFLLKVADRLEYSGPLLIKELAGIPFSGPSDISALRKLADFLRLEHAALLDHFYITACRNVSSSKIPFMGQLVQRDFISHGKSKVCPKCLDDGRPALAIWDLGLVTACSTHGCRLVETCCQCSKPLSWLRPRLYRCTCGADLRETKAAEAHTSEIVISALIEHRSGGPDRFRFADYGYCRELSECSLQNLLHAIEFVGAKFHRFLGDFSVSGRRRNDASETRAIIRTAHNILSNWPGNVQKALRDISYKAKSAVDDNGVYERAFQAFHRYRYPKSAGLGFIEAEFSKYRGTAGNRPLRLIGRKKTDDQTQQHWMTPPEAATMVGNISPAVFHLLARKGILKSKVEDDGMRRRGVWVDRDSVVDWLEDASNWISSREAEVLLGMNLSLMLKLSDAGLMATRRGGVWGLLETRNFRRADVERITFSFMRVDVPVLTCWENPNLQDLRRFRGGTEALKCIIEAVCEGLLQPVGKLMLSASVQDYLFDRRAVSELVQTRSGYSRAELMNRSEVEEFLTVAQVMVDALIREDFLSPLPRSGPGGECFFVKTDVLKFANNYVLAAPLARVLGVQSAWLQRSLLRSGVTGRTIKYRFATTAIYRKEDVDSHIERLVKDSRG